MSNFALHRRWDRLLTFWTTHLERPGPLPIHDPRYHNPNRILHPTGASPYSHATSKLDWAFGDCPLFLSSFLNDNDEDNDSDDDDMMEFAHTASPHSIFAFCGRECTLSVGATHAELSPYVVLGRMWNHVFGEETDEDPSCSMRSGLALLFRLCNMMFRHACVLAQHNVPLCLRTHLDSGSRWLRENGITNPDQFAAHALTPESLFAFMHVRVRIAGAAQQHPLLVHLLYTIAEMAHAVGILTLQNAINTDRESHIGLVDETIAMGVINSVCGEDGDVSVSRIVSFFMGACEEV